MGRTIKKKRHIKTKHRQKMASRRKKVLSRLLRNTTSNLTSNFSTPRENSSDGYETAFSSERNMKGQRRIKIRPTIYPNRKIHQKANLFDLDDFLRSNSHSHSHSPRSPRKKLQYKFKVTKRQPLNELDWQSSSSSFSSSSK